MNSNTIVVPAGVDFHFGSACGRSGFTVLVPAAAGEHFVLKAKDAEERGYVKRGERTVRESSSFCTQWVREIEVLKPCIVHCFSWIEPGHDRAWDIDREEGWEAREASRLEKERAWANRPRQPRG